MWASHKLSFLRTPMLLSSPTYFISQVSDVPLICSELKKLKISLGSIKFAMKDTARRWTTGIINNPLPDSSDRTHSSIVNDYHIERPLILFNILKFQFAQN